MFPITKPTIRDLLTRQRTRTYNPNLRATHEPATAPPAADAEQSERDWYFDQLVKECRERRCPDHRVRWLLAEAGRTEAELDAAIAAANCDDGKPATLPVANLIRVFEKETKMSDLEKRQIRSEWDAAVQAQHTAHPHWTKAKCISAVTVENPTLHQRLLDAANCDRR